jgi:cell pole-organizing protein PopZ
MSPEDEIAAEAARISSRLRDMARDRTNLSSVDCATLMAHSAMIDLLVGISRKLDRAAPAAAPRVARPSPAPREAAESARVLDDTRKRIRQQADEPSMEDILASIRRILSDDDEDDARRPARRAADAGEWGRPKPCAASDIKAATEALAETRRPPSGSDELSMENILASIRRILTEDEAAEESRIAARRKAAEARKEAERARAAAAAEPPRAAPAKEPSMEDILADIRRILSEDDDEPSAETHVAERAEAAPAAQDAKAPDAVAVAAAPSAEEADPDAPAGRRGRWLLFSAAAVFGASIAGALSTGLASFEPKPCDPIGRIAVEADGRAQSLCLGDAALRLPTASGLRAADGEAPPAAPPSAEVR